MTDRLSNIGIVAKWRTTRSLNFTASIISKTIARMGIPMNTSIHAVVLSKFLTTKGVEHELVAGYLYSKSGNTCNSYMWCKAYDVIIGEGLTRSPDGKEVEYLTAIPKGFNGELITGRTFEEKTEGKTHQQIVDSSKGLEPEQYLGSHMLFLYTHMYELFLEDVAEIYGNGLLSPVDPHFRMRERKEMVGVHPFSVHIFLNPLSKEIEQIMVG